MSALTQTDVRAIEELLTTTVEELEERDLEGWLEHWTDDAVVMPPNSEPAVGRAQMLAFIGTVSPPRISDVQIEGRDDLGVVTTAVDWTSKEPDGREVSHHGKQVLLLHKQPDGTWRYTKAIFNTNEPTIH